MYFFEVGLNWQLCISMSSVIPSQFVGRIQLLTSCFVCNIPECSFFFFFPEYIQTIMMMEESVQHVVMTAIQEVCWSTHSVQKFSFSLNMFSQTYTFFFLSWKNQLKVNKVRVE